MALANIIFVNDEEEILPAMRSRENEKEFGKFFHSLINSVDKINGEVARREWRMRKKVF